MRDSILTGRVFDVLARLGDVEVNESTRDLTSTELRARLPGVDACLVGWGTTRFDGEVIAEADTLQFLGVAAGTVAPYVSPALFESGVTVVNAAAAMAPSVAECGLLLILAGLRNLPALHQALSAGTWVEDEIALRQRGLYGRRVGLVGFGATARALVPLLRPFDVEILAHDPWVHPNAAEGLGVGLTGLDELLGWAEVVSIHAASTPATRHLLDERRLRLLGEATVLVNTARGALIDESALAAVLRDRPDLIAGLDVYEVEPLPVTSPLLRLPNVVLLPHVGGPTPDRRWRMAELVVQDLERFLDGRGVEHGVSIDGARLMTQ